MSSRICGDTEIATLNFKLSDPSVLWSSRLEASLNILTSYLMMSDVSSCEWVDAHSSMHNQYLNLSLAIRCERLANTCDDACSLNERCLRALFQHHDIWSGEERQEMMGITIRKRRKDRWRVTNHIKGVCSVRSIFYDFSLLDHGRGGSVKIESHSLKIRWTLRGSFSAVSTPIFASEDSLESSWWDPQDLHTFAPLRPQYFN